VHWVINDLRGYYSDLKGQLSPNKPYCGITNWRQFAGTIRKTDKDLLQKLPNFSDAILVTGCQRSGTTIMSRIFTQSKGMVNYWSGLDDELDAALILSGAESCSQKGRYCFQTTYLNERYHEYLNTPKSVKIVWVLRNPFDVIYSMLNNWRSSALWELYSHCPPPNNHKKIPPLLFPFKRLDIACSSYCGKLSQLLELAPTLPPNKLLIVNYEDLLENTHLILPSTFKFTKLEYDSSYASKLRKTSKPPSHDAMRSVIEKYCGSIYEEARKLSFRTSEE
jgi:hypothetical protein